MPRSHRAPLAAIPALALLNLIGCATIHPVGDERNALSGQAAADRIDWPRQYEPPRAPFTISNRIEIDAHPQTVWDILIHAASWSDYYDGATDIRVPTDDGRLARDTVFTWRTMDQDFTSTVTEFVPPYRLAWESRKPTIKAYHAWLIIPTDAGCVLITDESQFGLLANLQRVFLPNKLYNLHETWLGLIKDRAEAAQAEKDTRAAQPAPTAEGA